jgi:hypothetical protein
MQEKWAKDLKNTTTPSTGDKKRTAVDERKSSWEWALKMSRRTEKYMRKIFTGNRFLAACSFLLGSCLVVVHLLRKQLGRRNKSLDEKKK